MIASKLHPCDPFQLVHGLERPAKMDLDGPEALLLRSFQVLTNIIQKDSITRLNFVSPTCVNVELWFRFPLAM